MEVQRSQKNVDWLPRSAVWLHGVVAPEGEGEGRRQGVPGCGGQVNGSRSLSKWSEVDIVR